MYILPNRPLVARTTGALGRMRGLRGLGCGPCRGRRFAGLGQSFLQDMATAVSGQPALDPSAPTISPNISLPLTAPAAYSTPLIEAPAPQDSVLTAFQNMVANAPPPSSPLDYVSPQAAIAAGLPAAQVNAAWSGALNKSFATPQAAIAAGVPAGVVTQLWAGGTPPSATSWLDQTTLGISNKWLVGGGAAILALVALKRR